MSTQTTNYGLTKPAAEEYYNIAVSNANMDAIDAEMKALDNTKEALIKGQQDKTTMVDADALPLIDSSDSNKTKKISFANLKTLLKTIFATAEDFSALNSSLSAEITTRQNADTTFNNALSGVEDNLTDLAYSGDIYKRTTTHTTLPDLQISGLIYENYFTEVGSILKPLPYYVARYGAGGGNALIHKFYIMDTGLRFTGTVANSNFHGVGLCRNTKIDLTNINYIYINATFSTRAGNYTRVSVGVQKTYYPPGSVGYYSIGTPDSTSTLTAGVVDIVNGNNTINVSSLTGLYELIIDFNVYSTTDVGSLDVTLNNVWCDNTTLYPNGLLREFGVVTDIVYDKINSKVALASNKLTCTIDMPPLTTFENFIEWSYLKALLNTPNGTSVKFDIYDADNNLLKEDVKSGEILKLDNPIIKPKVTLARETLEIESPTFSWLDIEMRGANSNVGIWQDLGEITLSVDTLNLDIAVPILFDEVRICGFIAMQSNAALNVRFNDDSNASYSFNYGQPGSTSGSGNSAITAIALGSNFSTLITAPTKIDITISNLLKGKYPLLKSSTISTVSYGCIGGYSKSATITKISLGTFSTSKILIGSNFKVWGR